MRPRSAPTLRNCPCCCGLAVVAVRRFRVDGAEGRRYAIRCAGCGLATAWLESRADALERWNRRTPAETEGI